MNLSLRSSMTPFLKYALIIAAGVLLAVILFYMGDSLSTRHLLAISIIVVFVSLSTIFLRFYPDFLLIAFFFSIPITGIVKSLFLKGAYPDDIIGILIYSGTVGIGPMDLVIFALYATWFLRIFVARNAPLPKFEKADLWVFLLIVSYVISMMGTPDPKLALFSIIFLLRFTAVYFYISRNLEMRHIEWIFMIIFALILVESLLGLFQYSTGRVVGLAIDRGSGERLDQQHTVPGIEHRNRATGTLYESHTYGIFMVMLGQFAFVTMAAKFHGKVFRIIASILFMLAMLSVLVSFSRSAWLSCAIVLMVAWYVHIFIWRDRTIMTPTIIFGVILMVLSPWVISIVYERFASAGGELIMERFDQYPVAWDIWSDHFLFGYGVGNYMEALETYNVPGAAPLPVHNVFLWIGAESGLFGVIAFFGVFLAAMLRTWKIVRQQLNPRIARISLAIFCGLLAYLLDGLSDPLYREPVVYMMAWVLIGASVALNRISQQNESSMSPVINDPARP